MMHVISCETHVVPGPGNCAIDVYRPVSGSLRAAVVLLHGGAWVEGDRSAMAPYAQILAEQGFTAFAVQYRLSSQALWPAQLIDVRAAINWIAKASGQFGIDPARIALQGFSAGGHLALMAAGAALPEVPLTVRPGAVVALFAPPALKLPPPAAGPVPPRLLLGPDAGDAEAIAASPLTHIDPGFPPTFLLNGTGDPLVTHDDALVLFNRLMAAGVAVDLHLFAGQTHEFSELPRMLPVVQSAVAAFLDRAMIDPAGYQADNLRLNRFADPEFLRAIASPAAPQ